jgi:hypothetical protein
MAIGAVIAKVGGFLAKKGTQKAISAGATALATGSKFIKNEKAARVVGDVASVAGDVATFASIGSLFPGVGTIIGAGVGLVKGLFGVFSRGKKRRMAKLDQTTANARELLKNRRDGINTGEATDTGTEKNTHNPLTNALLSNLVTFAVKPLVDKGLEERRAARDERIAMATPRPVNPYANPLNTYNNPFAATRMGGMTV